MAMTTRIITIFFVKYILLGDAIIDDCTVRSPQALIVDFDRPATYIIKNDAYFVA
jgi:hypothetical protein